LAEVELENKGEEIQKPDWLGEEVTGNQKYYNSYLSIFPFREWKNLIK
jgi:adenylate cyclase